MSRDYDRDRWGRRYDEDQDRYGRGYERDYESDRERSYPGSDRKGSGRGYRSRAYDRESDYGRRGLESSWDVYGRSTTGRSYGRRDFGDREDEQYGSGRFRREGPSGRSAGGGYGREYGRESGYGRRAGLGRERDPGIDYDRDRYGYGYTGYGTTSRREGGRTYGQERGYGNEGRDWRDRTSDEVSSRFGDEESARRSQADEQRGTHRGRGPRGYRRSDERIREDVNDRLTDSEYLDASGIEVSVNGSEVTLTGTVNSRYEKRLAEDLAEQVSGVTNVENRLRVNLGQFGTGTADAMARRGEVGTEATTVTGGEKTKEVATGRGRTTMG